ncbi:hypothetical protein M3Y99_00990600 [Aphelenchoides fujianensis]|nr:hypothetical protein M3Y99_00990600 [Aphelenchoides fujianensis]
MAAALVAPPEDPRVRIPFGIYVQKSESIAVDRTEATDSVLHAPVCDVQLVLSRPLAALMTKRQLWRHFEFTIDGVRGQEAGKLVEIRLRTPQPDLVRSFFAGIETMRDDGDFDRVFRSLYAEFTELQIRMSRFECFRWAATFTALLGHFVHRRPNRSARAERPRSGEIRDFCRELGLRFASVGQTAAIANAHRRVDAMLKAERKAGSWSGAGDLLEEPKRKKPKPAETTGDCALDRLPNELVFKILNDVLVAEHEKKWERAEEGWRSILPLRLVSRRWCGIAESFIRRHAPIHKKVVFEASFLKPHEVLELTVAEQELVPIWHSENRPILFASTAIVHRFRPLMKRSFVDFFVRIQNGGANSTGVCMYNGQKRRVSCHVQPTFVHR